MGQTIIKDKQTNIPAHTAGLGIGITAGGVIYSGKHVSAALTGQNPSIATAGEFFLIGSKIPDEGIVGCMEVRTYMQLHVDVVISEMVLNLCDMKKKVTEIAHGIEHYIAIFNPLPDPIPLVFRAPIDFFDNIFDVTNNEKGNIDPNDNDYLLLDSGILIPGEGAVLETSFVFSTVTTSATSFNIVNVTHSTS
jgi:hypothetical protein